MAPGGPGRGNIAYRTDLRRGAGAVKMQGGDVRNGMVFDQECCKNALLVTPDTLLGPRPRAGGTNCIFL